jgi:hypothetical protein
MGFNIGSHLQEFKSLKLSQTLPEPFEFGLFLTGKLYDVYYEGVMAGKTTKPDYEFKKIEFVSIQLTADEKLAFKGWYETNLSESELLLETFIQSGYKTSIVWDTNKDCFIASSTCTNDKSKNYDKCLTSRSNNWLEALMLNLWKTDVLSKKGVWEATTKDNWG